MSLHTIFVLHFCSGHKFNEYFLSHSVKLCISFSPVLFSSTETGSLYFILIFALASLREASIAIFTTTRYGYFLYFSTYAVDAYILTSVLSMHTVHAICVHRKIPKTSLCI